MSGMREFLLGYGQLLWGVIADILRKIFPFGRHGQVDMLGRCWDNSHFQNIMWGVRGKAWLWFSSFIWKVINSYVLKINLFLMCWDHHSIVELKKKKCKIGLFFFFFVYIETVPVNSKYKLLNVCDKI